MARNPMRAPAKRKQPAAVETSQSIEEQTREFLKSGKEIQVIQSGVSGQPSVAAIRRNRSGDKAVSS